MAGRVTAMGVDQDVDVSQQYRPLPSGPAAPHCHRDRHPVEAPPVPYVGSSTDSRDARCRSESETRKASWTSAVRVRFDSAAARLARARSSSGRWMVVRIHQYTILKHIDAVGENWYASWGRSSWPPSCGSATSRASGAAGRSTMRDSAADSQRARRRVASAASTRVGHECSSSSLTCSRGGVSPAWWHGRSRTQPSRTEGLPGTSGHAASRGHVPASLEAGGAVLSKGGVHEFSCGREP